MKAQQLAEEIKETQAILARLLESLEEAQKQSDPFGVFVYRERRDYPRYSDADHSKSGKRTREWTEDSYRRAMTAGFRGDYIAWVHVLRAYTPEWHRQNPHDIVPIMCGRFTQTLPAEEIAEVFRITGNRAISGIQYDIRPSTRVPTVRLDS